MAGVIIIFKTALEFVKMITFLLLKINERVFQILAIDSPYISQCLTGLNFFDQMTERFVLTDYYNATYIKRKAFVILHPTVNVLRRIVN